MSVRLFPISRRRWLRTSVRGLIVLVLLVGASLGWLVRSARIQREAVAAIERAGGRVEYDWHERNGQIWPLDWIVDRVGIDFCLHVDYVSVGNGAPNRQLDDVVGLNQLEYLDLSGLTISDVGLVQLKTLRSLKSLS